MNVNVGIADIIGTSSNSVDLEIPSIFNIGLFNKIFATINHMLLAMKLIPEEPTQQIIVAVAPTPVKDGIPHRAS